MNAFKTKMIDRFLTPNCLGMNWMTPLTVSMDKKVLYFHIAKTGGSSIVKLLENNNLNDRVLSDKRRAIAEKKDYFMQVLDEWDDYYKFTFVRNKYDLLTSLYNYDRQLNGKYSLSTSVQFVDFIENYVGDRDTIKNEGLYCEAIDQYYLTHLDGINLFDFIGRFENFNDDLNKVCNKLEIENTQIHVNEGNYDRSKKESYYTEPLRENVRSKFPQEFEHFGWEDLGGEK